MSGILRDLAYTVQLLCSQSLLFYSLNLYGATVFTGSVVRELGVQDVRSVPVKPFTGRIIAVSIYY